MLYSTLLLHRARVARARPVGRGRAPLAAIRKGWLKMDLWNPDGVRPTHTHPCWARDYEKLGRCGVPVGCATRPDHTDDGPECPVDDSDFLCEDHYGLRTCDYCGEYGGPPLVNYDRGQWHPTCVEEDDLWMEDL